MGVHIGKKIKEEVSRQGIPVVEFAKKINRSRNVVYDIFDRQSVDTDLLHKIGRVLHCDFFSLYSAQKEYSQDGFKTFAVRENPESSYGDHDEIEMIKRQNELLKTEVTYLKKIVGLLEKGRKKSTK